MTTTRETIENRRCCAPLPEAYRTIMEAISPPVKSASSMVAKTTMIEVVDDLTLTNECYSPPVSVTTSMTTTLQETGKDTNKTTN